DQYVHGVELGLRRHRRDRLLLLVATRDQIGGKAACEQGDTQNGKSRGIHDASLTLLRGHDDRMGRPSDHLMTRRVADADAHGFQQLKVNSWLTPRIQMRLTMSC